MSTDRFLRFTHPPPVAPYRGRGHRELGCLRELWFHLTEACNLECRHCLFDCNNNRPRQLDPEDVKKTVEEAVDLGCRLVCFTGGEPLLHPQFSELLSWTTRDKGLRAAVLTNGLLLRRLIEQRPDAQWDRVHFQISVDGPEGFHDAVRGKGAYRQTAENVHYAVGRNIPCSAVMAVSAENFDAMAEFVEDVHGLGVSTVHFMWHIVRGRGAATAVAPADRLIPAFRKAADRARFLGVAIDNVEAIRAQVFTPPGTRFDFGNGAWESLAVGPDGAIYATPAMVDRAAFRAGSFDEGLERVWRESPVLKRFRNVSLLDIPEMRDDPWRFIIGGGDLDHCVTYSGSGSVERPLHPDPYAPLYRDIAMRLIEEEAQRLPKPDGLAIILRMGDVATECPSTAEVNFTHSNCLLSMGDADTRGLVRAFYAGRAAEPDETILNPARYEDTDLDFIPEEGLVRMYGCGSPVADAAIKPGETVADLGCGAGVECFLAAKAAGAAGRIIGVDMTDAMLEIARRSQKHVNDKLGFENTEFRKGFLEDMPLEDGTVDCALSNCVVNLSHNKRRVYAEILRILKPGGRLVISDVVAETEPPLAVRADHKLIGECLGGALVQEYLVSLLEDIGFEDVRIIKRFPYRTVQQHPFYSLTFEAFRPRDASGARRQDALYAGPFSAVVAPDGAVLPKGRRVEIALDGLPDPGLLADAGVLLLDPSSGAVTNADYGPSCTCCAPTEAAGTCGSPTTQETSEEAGCLVCGAPLTYLPAVQTRVCAVCGKKAEADAQCEQGHFVCDTCHARDPVQAIHQMCIASTETDMVRLFLDIRLHPSFHVHGPEYHALVPGVILATYRNLGGDIADSAIHMGIDRGARIPGGSCAFTGGCGGALGCGIALSILLRATPLTPEPRQAVLKTTAAVTAALAQQPAARCCQRECLLALQELARVSKDLLPIPLRAETVCDCTQYRKNRECLVDSCPFFPTPSQKPQGVV